MHDEISGGLQVYCTELHEPLLTHIYLDGFPAVSSLFLLHLYVCNYIQIIIMDIINLHLQNSPSPQPKVAAAAAATAVETEKDNYVLKRNYGGNSRSVWVNVIFRMLTLSFKGSISSSFCGNRHFSLICTRKFQYLRRMHVLRI